MLDQDDLNLSGLLVEVLNTAFSPYNNYLDRESGSDPDESWTSSDLTTGTIEEESEDWVKSETEENEAVISKPEEDIRIFSSQDAHPNPAPQQSTSADDTSRHSDSLGIRDSFENETMDENPHSTFYPYQTIDLISLPDIVTEGQRTPSFPDSGYLDALDSAPLTGGQPSMDGEGSRSRINLETEILPHYGNPFRSGPRPSSSFYGPLVTSGGSQLRNTDKDTQSIGLDIDNTLLNGRWKGFLKEKQKSTTR